jgi:hypothetical protein
VLGESLARDRDGAELLDGSVPALVADGGGHPGAGRARELDRRCADAPRAPVDQQALTRGQPGLREERVVRGGEDLGEPSRRGPVELVRDRHRRPLVNHGELGLPTAAHDRHHAVAV